MRLIVAIFFLVMLTACIGKNIRQFKIENVAKADIDLVTDIHIEQLQRLTKYLTVKLYKRNPKELKKNPEMTIDKRIYQLMKIRKNPKEALAELGHLDNVAALNLAFSEDFSGDRVFALMAGVTVMLSNSYNNQLEFYMLDDIDQQKLYNSARNLEIISWKLNNLKDENGNVLLLSNGYSANGVANYSYERVLSQMIIIQDMMAILISDSTNRTINKVVHGLASFFFIPV
ncbi:hypothetical protein [Psychromonas ingrahamii]|nr:hypothetical protein [Psychromonas ingrahamii]